MTKKLIVIGNGMAPGRMLEKLVEADASAYDITIFNAEPRVNYNRLMLSPVLSGEKTYRDIITHDDAWYASHGITLQKGEKITSVDRDAKTVTSAGGITASYDKLVIATGSSPFIIPVEGHELEGVLVYRDLDDVDAMLSAAKSGGRAVVIGGGLLGLEAAAGLKEQGMDVTVLHLMPTLMERQLDEASGHLLEKAFKDRGVDVLTKANTKRILGSSGRVTGVELEDGVIIDAAIVVMAVGIRPSTQLAKAAGLDVKRGIVVADDMRTSDPDIFALGECVEHNGHCYGLVAPLYDMATVISQNLLDGSALYEGSVTATKLKVTGIDLYSAGDFAQGEGREEIVLRDATAGVYKRLVLQENRIVGAVLYGETSDGPWFFDLLKKGKDVSEMRDTLIFGQAFQGGTPLDPSAAVAALPDDAEICGCNGICKSTITSAITSKGLTTLEEVRTHTKASASCGSCTGLVEQLMAATLGAAYSPAAITPVCGCTDLGHDEVRRLILAKELKSIPQVMQELEWKTSCGCAKCRPALNYYLVCDWPEEYADDYQSRYINERVHANIQKDGTYSVVPRMWGGMTSSAELRAIADVVDKYDIPSVKCTGGQRIDMLGVKKEDLPLIWEDLGKVGFVSGHAYAKGLRTVKTCVGTDWCRFGTQDSTGFGIRLEKFMWGSWTPAKLKLAVSGCPRNCSEATCKDIGIICVDSGFEIHFGGAAGLEIQGTQVLGTLPTEDETLEHVVALTQMYREQGRYLERIYKWADRIGYEEIRRQIMEDADKRKHYFDRFVASQKVAQVDPWSERVSGKDKHEFNPMKTLEMEAAE
ncbi:Nitrite reductase [NAD(P)H] [Pseudovibrio axinellae]|uniref:Nitrite reductase [NAD(P)H] n=1 Tax=Pseudovibrio axinellae TaxID=989403 RepID=A0A166BDQ1_9HYPH|nr:nitrite reductase large subunit NirB [Pseudovibrio axinellae]KZL22161.1 Nitrite reductase [NAD(P)H] [Pseudovibrio axinellae]SEQ52906.1 assimilatory nitrite reductase (NAD(P)H) large subunit precursor [Pseudovibrio axinellae]